MEPRGPSAETTHAHHGTRVRGHGMRVWLDESRGRHQGDRGAAAGRAGRGSPMRYGCGGEVLG
jgi:hypothetical protein